MPKHLELLENLPQLQNLIKRDKDSYKDEFSSQFRHYEALKSLFELNPDKESKEFGDLINFISHVSHCYPDLTKDFPKDLVNFLSVNYLIIDPALRKIMVQALILMRNKSLLSLVDLLELFFTLFKCKDKTLRALLHSHIVADIKNANQKAKDNRLNKTLQNFMWKMLNDEVDIAAKKSLDVMIELYKKQIWNDTKTVNIIAEACFSKVQKVASTALGFFLNSNEVKQDEENEDVPDLSRLKHSNSCNKKTKSRKNQMEKVLAGIKRKERAKSKVESFNFSALHLINDPQGFSEKLFSRLRQVHSTNEFRFEIRILFLNLISRLIGLHKLFVLNFYDFMIPYLKPQQKEITSLLAYVAQASHELVPPDSLETVIYAIADNFVWSNCASEVITAGMNSLREICIRCPLAMPETLLQSLMEDYKNHREKGPMNAARSLLGLYREINPELLRKKDRGKNASMNMKTFKAAKYGETRVSSGVEGAELLLESDQAPTLVGEEDEEIPELDQNEISEAEAEIEEVLSEDEDEDHEDADFEEDSDGDHDETNDESQKENQVEIEHVQKRRKLGIAAEKILTDEDFKKIKELKLQKEAENMMGVKNSKKIIQNSDDENDEVVDSSKITSGIRRKDDYEARLEKIKAGRDGRTFGSKKGSTERTSITNKVKSKKNKAFMMMVHKKDVKNKAKRSLREKQRSLRAHIKKQKMKK